MHGAQLTGFLDRTKKAPEECIYVEKQDKTQKKVPTPEYDAWLTQD
jgi:hypothetical protein